MDARVNVSANSVCEDKPEETGCIVVEAEAEGCFGEIIEAWIAASCRTCVFFLYVCSKYIFY